MEALTIPALALAGVLLQGMLGWRWTLILAVPLVIWLARRPVWTAAIALIATN